MRSPVTQGQTEPLPPCHKARNTVNLKQAPWSITRSRWGDWRDEGLICRYEMSGKPGKKDFIHIPVVTGECPTMYKAARGRLKVLSGFKEASDYLETKNKNSSEILVTTEIDWSWTRILEHFAGVITNHGTPVSRAAEVLGLMNKLGVLGTQKATETLHSGTQAYIVCDGNEALVYLVREKLEEQRSVLALH